MYEEMRNLALFLEKRRLSGASYCYLQLPDGRVQRRWSRCLLRDPKKWSSRGRGIVAAEENT
ncbi:unnamed protein product [Bubo scandiacus]